MQELVAFVSTAVHSTFAKNAQQQMENVYYTGLTVRHTTNNTGKFHLDLSARLWTCIDSCMTFCVALEQQMKVFTQI